VPPLPPYPEPFLAGTDRMDGAGGADGTGFDGSGGAGDAGDGVHTGANGYGGGGGGGGGGDDGAGSGHYGMSDGVGDSDGYGDGEDDGAGGGVSVDGDAGAAGGQGGAIATKMFAMAPPPPPPSASGGAGAGGAPLHVYTSHGGGGGGGVAPASPAASSYAAPTPGGSMGAPVTPGVAPATDTRLRPVMRGRIMPAAGVLKPGTYLYDGVWAMAETDTVWSEFKYNFTVSTKQALPPPPPAPMPDGTGVVFNPLLPYSKAHAAVNTIMSGYFLLQAVPPVPGAAAVTAVQRHVDKEVKLRIGGPVPFDAYIPPQSHDGKAIPYDSLVGITGEGSFSSMKYLIAGAYHPPSGTAWLRKVYQAKGAGGGRGGTPVAATLGPAIGPDGLPMGPPGSGVVRQRTMMEVADPANIIDAPRRVSRGQRVVAGGGGGGQGGSLFVCASALTPPCHSTPPPPPSLQVMVKETQDVKACLTVSPRCHARCPRAATPPP
jgi:hypothetical protein